jgi:thymidylate synthase (FAD)
MKLIDPKFEDLSFQYTDPIRLAERCIRVCYKSEDKIGEGTDIKLINSIAKSGHCAMLEHISVYLTVPVEVRASTEEMQIIQSIIKSKYSRVISTKKLVYISTNMRVIYENSVDMFNEFLMHRGEHFIYDVYKNITNCKPEESDNFYRRVTILFDMDRVGSQSFCRHRTFSFAQESTRWCNYIKDKFGSEISISTPCWLNSEDKDEFNTDMETLEKLYFKWINKGYKAQEARYFLPFGLHTQIIMTGFVDDWKHFFELRNDSHAHVQAQELAKPLEDYFIEKKYI